MQCHVASQLVLLSLAPLSPRFAAWCLSAWSTAAPLSLKMAKLMDSNVLNKSVDKVATFVVKVVGVRVSQYTYPSEKDTTTVTAHKFEAWMVGANLEYYCVGYVKGLSTMVTKARDKHTDGSVGLLSNVVLHTRTRL